MTQQTIDLDVNPSEENSEDLTQARQRTGVADPTEAAWNPPRTTTDISVIGYTTGAGLACFPAPDGHAAGSVQSAE